MGSCSSLTKFGAMHTDINNINTVCFKENGLESMQILVTYTQWTSTDNDMRQREQARDTVTTNTTSAHQLDRCHTASALHLLACCIGLLRTSLQSV